uniref:Uncharacterized protein n=1 Tax=Tetranychus urticae TaxID=32264 RepID=T1L357_TETUR
MATRSSYSSWSLQIVIMIITLS